MCNWAILPVLFYDSSITLCLFAKAKVPPHIKGRLDIHHYQGIIYVIGVFFFLIPGWHEWVYAISLVIFSGLLSKNLDWAHISSPKNQNCVVIRKNRTFPFLVSSHFMLVLCSTMQAKYHIYEYKRGNDIKTGLLLLGQHSLRHVKRDQSNLPNEGNNYGTHITIPVRVNDDVFKEINWVKSGWMTGATCRSLLFKHTQNDFVRFFLLDRYFFMWWQVYALLLICYIINTVFYFCM